VVSGLLDGGLLPTGSMSGLWQRIPGVADQQRPGGSLREDRRVPAGRRALQRRSRGPRGRFQDDEPGRRGTRRGGGDRSAREFEVREEDDGPFAVFVLAAETAR